VDAPAVPALAVADWRAPSTDSEMAAIMRGLNLPGWTAAVQYGSGCRIRRVKLKSRTRHTKTAKTPILILSRRLLEKARASDRAA
jgi:hypothetical protein